MLSKKNRAGAEEIKKMFKGSRFLVSSSLTFRYLKTNNQEVKISFIAPKNVAKLAVERNQLRRRGYFVLRKYIHQFPAGLIGAFVFKKYQDDILILENEIKNIINKVH